ncbi:ABC transporter permease [Streptosporangium saharense]|uniref:Peptide/nickel transport system permease protein n=1 Tax=Streptosporangium saharense TaxID=1706840 RepID=A0A7W7QRH1_9ACTN|nr:ABC transporter permease [Streptosporangium saharense]MBB4918410.1 peptide/nickel transport system permease protein [Streptosporangium saharense]
MTVSDREPASERSDREPAVAVPPARLAADDEPGLDPVPAVPPAAPRTVPRRYGVRPGQVVALLFLAVIAVAALAPGLLSGADPLAADPLHALAPPSAQHWFGTDHLGRDVLSRVVHGAGYSLGIGAAAILFAAVLGTVLGALAGLSPRYVDEPLSRLFDVLASFPELLLAMLVISVTGPGAGNVILAIGLVQLPNYARVIRGQTFVVRRSGYVEQAVTLGLRRPTLVVRHVLPNILGPLPVLATIGMGTAIIATSGLSFLGMGPQPPDPEWGSMLAEARNYLRVAWWSVLFPGLFVTLTVVSLTAVGRRLQRRFEGRLP